MAEEDEAAQTGVALVADGSGFADRRARERGSGVDGTGRMEGGGLPGGLGGVGRGGTPPAEERAVRSTHAERRSILASKVDETLVVQMRPVPAGGIVKDVAYQAHGGTDDQLKVQMVQRYGRPNVAASADLEMTWCGDGERCCTALGAATPALNVKEEL